MEPFKAFKLSEVEGHIQAGFVECTLEELDAGEVVVEVAYSDVNYKDALAATGKGRILLRPSCIGGIDLAGVVVSSLDERFKPGDAVLATGYELGVKHHGGYARYARVPADWLVPLPEGLSLFESMALGTAGFSAALGIVRMEQNGLRPESGPVVVPGATGGVGSVAVAALARLGYHVVALTGKASEKAWLEGLGAREVLLRSELDLGRIKPLGRTAWAGAVDNLGGEVLAWLLSGMKVGGTVASVGLAASPTLSATVFPFILRGVSLLGVDSVNCPMPLRREVWRRLATDLRPPRLAEMTRTVPFEQLPGVFEDFIAVRVRGRLVVEVSPGLNR